MEAGKERNHYSDLQVKGDLFFFSPAPDLSTSYVLLFQTHRRSPDPRPWGTEAMELPDLKARA